MDYFCPNDGSFMRTGTMTNDSGQTTLVFQCRCGYYKEATERDTKVYRRDYTNAPLVEQIKHNRYFLLDPTLPRVSDVVCANSDCLTRRKETGLVMFSHHMADLTDKEVDEAVKAIPGYRAHWRIGLEQVAVSVKGEKPEVCVFGGRKVVAEPYKQPRQESIMIKYDAANMKYLYICCCCGHNKE
jgi:hypothetical protein